MAFESKDGSKFSMASRRNAHDSSMNAKEKRGMSVDLGKKPQEQILDQPAQDEENVADPSQIAEEHGPAQHVSIEHDLETGVHHVHSTHPDGHEHHSQHEDGEEAHEHGKKLAGVGEPEQEPEDEMEDYGEGE